MTSLSTNLSISQQPSTLLVILSSVVVCKLVLGVWIRFRRFDLYPTHYIRTVSELSTPSRLHIGCPSAVLLASSLFSTLTLSPPLEMPTLSLITAFLVTVIFISMALSLNFTAFCLQLRHTFLSQSPGWIWKMYNSIKTLLNDFDQLVNIPQSSHFPCRWS